MVMAYLDNSATTKPCDSAVAAMMDCMREGFYNPSSVYRPAVDAFRAVRECRELLLKAAHAQDCELVFTSGGTEANNLAILGSVAKMRGPQVVAVSAVEHPSVLEAFHALKALGHDVRIIDVDEKGEINWPQLEAALEAGAKLVSCMQVNNETGALLDVERLYRVIDQRALLHIDGVQGFLRVPFDMKYADLYSISGHKLHAPKGVGALIVRKGVRIAPRQIGGGQESGLRSGTENTPGIAGFRAAVEELLGMGDTVYRSLMDQKLRMLSLFKDAVPNLLINGPDPERAAPHIINLSFPNVRGEVMLHALESSQVYVSTGSACSSKKLKTSSVLKAMGIDSARSECAIRFSISPHTSMEEIEYASQILGQTYEQLQRFRRR